jgi:nicotinate-nucleotide adenylyltransferase
MTGQASEGERAPFRQPGSASGAFVRLPRFARGQAIGLLGGSFNPPHDGHRLISELALRRLRLDRLWWLATPGNPLKSAADLAEMRERLEAARGLARDPRIAVTGFEAEIGSRYTYDTIAWLERRAPGVRFVWIMGADNLSQFHRWRHWREIADIAPILVVDRPGSTLRALGSRAARALAPYRLPESAASDLAAHAPPAFVFLHGRRSSQSSTALREAAKSEGTSS